MSEWSVSILILLAVMPCLPAAAADAAAAVSIE